MTYLRGAELSCFSNETDYLYYLLFFGTLIYLVIKNKLKN
jgi:hypothetical protein